jgi:signal transduction histidine kinase
LTARSADGPPDNEAVAVLRDGAIVLANATFLHLCGEAGAAAWDQVIRAAETRPAAAADTAAADTAAADTAAADREIELRQGDGKALRRRIRIEPLLGNTGQRAVLVRIGDGPAPAPAADTEELRRRAGQLAHDLNNAIGSLLLNAQLALEALDQAAPGRADIEEMRQAGESAAELTRRLQALSRGEPS